MPNREPNPNRIDRQKTPDSPPPPDHGARMSPDEGPDWTAVAHAEADEGARGSDAAPPTHGTDAGGGRPSKPRVED